MERERPGPGMEACLSDSCCKRVGESRDMALSVRKEGGAEMPLLRVRGE